MNLRKARRRWVQLPQNKIQWCALLWIPSESREYFLPSWITAGLPELGLVVYKYVSSLTETGLIAFDVLTAVTVRSADFWVELSACLA
jgi:hypothetical protein